MAMACKLKAKCPNKTPPLFNCWNPDCKGWVHENCCRLLLNTHDVPEAERPTVEDRDPSNAGEPEPVLFCTKTCYSKWRAIKKREEKALVNAQKEAVKEKKKKKVPWEDDGSLEVPLDWLTTEENYANHCGSNGNISGKSKTQCHKELAVLIKEKKPQSERDQKDVENKIVSLERQFRTAMDWANNTGQGVDKPGEFEAAVLKRCPLFHQLEPVMGDRPNAKPLASNESDDEISLGAASSGSGVADIAALQSANNAPEELFDDRGAVNNNKNYTPSSKSTSSSVSATKKRLISATAKAPTNKKSKGKGIANSADAMVSNFLGEDAAESTYHQLREREVVAREREANARMIEAETNSTKAKRETSLLTTQEKATLLRERQKLKNDGVSQEDIDALLPIKK